jgi:hypothetical protein
MPAPSWLRPSRRLAGLEIDVAEVVGEQFEQIRGEAVAGA